MGDMAKDYLQIFINDPLYSVYPMWDEQAELDKFKFVKLDQYQGATLDDYADDARRMSALGAQYCECILREEGNFPKGAKIVFPLPYIVYGPSQSNNEPYLILLYLSDTESEGAFYLTSAEAERTDIEGPWYYVIAV